MNFIFLRYSPYQRESYHPWSHLQQLKENSAAWAKVQKPLPSTKVSNTCRRWNMMKNGHHQWSVRSLPEIMLQFPKKKHVCEAWDQSPAIPVPLKNYDVILTENCTTTRGFWVNLCSRKRNIKECLVQGPGSTRYPDIYRPFKGVVSGEYNE